MIFALDSVESTEDITKNSSTIVFVTQANEILMILQRGHYFIYTQTSIVARSKTDLVPWMPDLKALLTDALAETLWLPLTLGAGVRCILRVSIDAAGLFLNCQQSCRANSSPEVHAGVLKESPAWNCLCRFHCGLMCKFYCLCHAVHSNRKGERGHCFFFFINVVIYVSQTHVDRFQDNLVKRTWDKENVIRFAWTSDFSKFLNNVRSFCCFRVIYRTNTDRKKQQSHIQI